ncbi:nitric oxide-sensing protein NosP [Psychromonas ossibalaenae]|uniref:nitric oxide-sensing protein NosP n=1 Tax=Psychromonas ossibalaenae TaxID=444922 RepID=UPI00036EA87B|nr:nitric oxide-sensing protein NosP [Psychromonas ossibalaenae]
MTNIKTITALSSLSETQQASEEIYQQLNHDDIGFILFYCSSTYSLPALASAMQVLFSGIKVVGCTTAGEVSSAGNQEHSIVAVGFSSNYFSISAELIKSMAGFDLLDAQKTINRLSEQCASKELTTIKDNTFLLTLLDGLSFEEEHFLAALNSAAAGIPHFGGSAGADDNLSKTHVYYNGQFLQQAAVVIMVNSTCPFEVFNCHHIKQPAEKLVVTAVDAQSRTVYELNAEPAAAEYARLLNLEVKDLCPKVFSLNPLAVKVGGQYYVRSIQKVNEADLSLTFYCAVDLGIVLTAVEMDDILHSLSAKLVDISQRYGNPELVLACDCVLRRLEIEHKNLNNKVQVLNSEYKIAGFNTYGEHINGIHLNQTFTGVYIAGGNDAVKRGK